MGTRWKRKLGRYLHSIDSVSPCEEKGTVFINLMKTGFDIILPAKDVKANHPPWITTEFKKLIESKQQTFHS